MTAREQFELGWPALLMGEGIYCEWPQVLHVRVTFGEWDERFLMLEMVALDTWGFAQKHRPSPRCGARWDQLRCTPDELVSPSWSLYWHSELLRSVVLRASVSGRARWTRAQYQVLRDYITDWELDRVEARAAPALPGRELDSKPRR